MRSPKGAVLASLLACCALSEPLLGQAGCFVVPIRTRSDTVSQRIRCAAEAERGAVLVELWSSPDLDLLTLNVLQWESARLADVQTMKQLATIADSATSAPKRVAALGTLFKVADRSLAIRPSDTLRYRFGGLPRATDQGPPAPTVSRDVARQLVTVLAKEAKHEDVRRLATEGVRILTRPIR
jgi:hypothetical protein